MTRRIVTGKRLRLAGVWCGALLLPAGLVALPQSPHAAPPAAAAGPLTVVYSGETDGYLTPCGCSSPMLGGLPRRATFLHDLATRAAVLSVDDGDLTEALGRQDEMKAETLTDMLDHLGYAAIGLGENDFRLGLPVLQALQARGRMALLCANARLPDGAPALKEYTVVRRVAGGHASRVAITAVLSDRFLPLVSLLCPDMHFERVAQTLTRLGPALREAGDARILLYHGPAAEAEEFARRFPLFQLIVCAHDGDVPPPPKRVGATMIVSATPSGKHVGTATFAAAPAWRVSETADAPLGPELGDDAATVQIERAYQDRVAAEDLLAKAPRAPTVNGDTFAGSAACRSCHAAAYRVWQSSGHASALKALQNVRQDRDPECVSCHVVGLDRVGGFVSPARTPDLAAVGCESCHGPAARHVRDPAANHLPKLDQGACLGCHNPQNSPRFQFQPYWAKVKH